MKRKLEEMKEALNRNFKVTVDSEYHRYDVDGTYLLDRGSSYRWK